MDLETSKGVSRNLPSAPTAAALPRGESSLTESAAAVSARRTRIKSEEAGVELNLGELWQYRELLYFLTLRDIKVRYKQTLMGVAWVIIQPLLSMFLFTLFFNRFAGLKSGTMPYPLFAYAGLILWTFLSNAVINST